MAKVAEHTWGLNVVSDPSAGSAWSNADFDQVRNRTGYQLCESSWLEQRAFNEWALDALGPLHPLTKRVQAAWDDLVASRPDTSLLQPVADLGSVFTCKMINSSNAVVTVQYSFDATGGMVQLDVDADGTTSSWASAQSTLGRFVYSSFAEEDYSGFPNFVFNGKPGSDASTKSADWNTSLVGLWVVPNTNECSVVLQLKMTDSKCVTFNGAPEEIWINVDISQKSNNNNVNNNNSTSIAYKLQWFGKRPTRLAESFMFVFTPLLQPNITSHCDDDDYCYYRWAISKMDSTLIDPLDVVWGGSQLQHAAWDGVLYRSNSSSSSTAFFLKISSPDVAIVSPVLSAQHATPLVPFVNPIVDEIKGFGFNMFNNIWNTK